MRTLQETIDILRKDNRSRLWDKQFNKFTREDWIEIDRLEAGDKVIYLDNKWKRILKISTNKPYDNISQAARANGIHRNTLYGYLRRNVECDYRYL